MTTTQANTTTRDETDNEHTTLSDVSPEVDAYFRRTIGSYRCDRCATEFDVESVLASSRSDARTVRCPVCHDDHLRFTPAVEPSEEGLDVDHLSSQGRDVCRPPKRRRHRHYEQPRWATCHVEDVDRMYVAEPFDEDDDEVRVDLDGVGSGGASTHDTGVNLNLSVWFTREQAKRLGEQLVANAEVDE